MALNFANVNTQAFADSLPTTRVADGKTITNATLADWAVEGWRQVTSQADPTDGYRVASWNIVEDDSLHCHLTVASEVNIADEAAANAAEARTAETQWLISQLSSNSDVLPFVMKAMVAELRADLVTVAGGGQPRTQNELIVAIASTATSYINNRP